MRCLPSLLVLLLTCGPALAHGGKHFVRVRLKRARRLQRRTFQLEDVNRRAYPRKGESEAQFLARLAKDPELRQRQWNCANCALALDATLAGHPTVAAAKPDPRLDNTWFRQRFNKGAEGLLVPAVGRSVRTAAGEQLYGSRSVPDVLTAAMKKHGPGARGIIIGYYRDKDGVLTSHTFNVANQRGRVRFLDGQSGRRASFTANDYLFFELIRTDRQ